LLGAEFLSNQLRAPVVLRKRSAEITAGKEPAKRLFFRESFLLASANSNP
jgi:hypothetical protein